MNKFIFLDIDGVMNSNLFYSERTQDKRYNDWIKEHPQRIAWNACNIDPRAVERLNRLTDATGLRLLYLLPGEVIVICRKYLTLLELKNLYMT